MKAILEFTLPEDSVEHKQAVKALDMALVIWHFANNSKKALGYEIDDIEDKYEVLDKVFERFYELLEEYNVKPDELIV